MNDDFKAAQDSAVMAIAQSIEAEWLRVVVNYEMLYQEDGIEHDRLGFYITKQPDGNLAKAQLRFTDLIVEAFLKLNEASLTVNKEHWTMCDFVLDSDGKFEVNFSYDPPKRINAILDEESYYRFGKYLEFYKSSRGIK